MLYFPFSLQGQCSCRGGITRGSLAAPHYGACWGDREGTALAFDFPGRTEPAVICSSSRLQRSRVCHRVLRERVCFSSLLGKSRSRGMQVPMRDVQHGSSRRDAGVICFSGLSPTFASSELGAVCTLLFSRISVCFQLIISETSVSWSIDPSSRCATRCLPQNPRSVKAQARGSDASMAQPDHKGRGLELCEVIGVERKSLNMNVYFSVLWQCTPAA